MNWLTCRNLLTLFLLLCICVTGCKKYEEGPAIALRTVNKRITGTWEMKRLLVDDVDETSALLAHPANCIYRIKRDDCGHCYELKLTCQNGTKYNGEFVLRNNKKSLAYSGAGGISSPYGPIGNGSVAVTWKIQKLTMKEMKHQTLHIDGKVYELTFTKISN